MTSSELSVADGVNSTSDSLAEVYSSSKSDFGANGGAMWPFSGVTKNNATDNLDGTYIKTEKSRHDRLTAESLADAISQWPEWMYRRVDSFHPLEGARGRLKHSMDCIPPPDPRLAYDNFERDYEFMDEVHGQLMVPLAFISKGTMRHFDMSQSGGAHISLLGSEEACELMANVLVEVLRKNGVDATDELYGAMWSLVSSVGEDNLEKAKALISATRWGHWGKQELWPYEVEIDSSTKELLINLSTDFVLIGLIPASTAGTRQILKFSYHWEISSERKSRFVRTWNSWRAAFRISPLELALPMHMPAQTSSYHLEFQVPPELDIKELRLPEATGFAENHVRYPVDESRMPVAHVHARYEKVPREAAKVQLLVPRRGIWNAALIASVLTAIIFFLALLLPNAIETLRQVGGNAAALLLATPAVFVGFLAISKEPIFSSRMLNPLRIIIGICALLLFAMAASLVGKLSSPYLEIFWWVGAGVSSAASIGILWGENLGWLSSRR